MVEAVAAFVYVANQLDRGSPLCRQVLYYTALQSYTLVERVKTHCHLPIFLVYFLSLLPQKREGQSRAWNGIRQCNEDEMRRTELKQQMAWVHLPIMLSIHWILCLRLPRLT